MASDGEQSTGENDLRTTAPGVGGVGAQNGPGAPAGAEQDPGFAFQGGPVISSPEVYVSFWGGSWSDPAHAKRQANLAQFVQDLLDSDYMNILSQYGVGQGAGDGSAYWGSSTLPSATGDMSDADVHKAIQSLIDDGQLPEPERPSNMALIVFLDESIGINDAGLGVVLCEPSGDNAFGYHYFFTTTGGHQFYYSVIPCLNDACLTNSCADDATCSLHLAATQEQRQTQVASHEFSEMVTDPEVSGWRDPTTGAENGDICNGRTGTISVGGRSWAAQLMYSKTDDATGAEACVLAPPQPLASLLPAPPYPPPTS